MAPRACATRHGSNRGVPLRKAFSMNLWVAGKPVHTSMDTSPRAAARAILHASCSCGAHCTKRSQLTCAISDFSGRSTTSRLEYTQCRILAEPRHPISCNGGFQAELRPQPSLDMQRANLWASHSHAKP